MPPTLFHRLRGIFPNTGVQNLAYCVLATILQIAAAKQTKEANKQRKLELNCLITGTQRKATRRENSRTSYAKKTGELEGIYKGILFLFKASSITFKMGQYMFSGVSNKYIKLLRKFSIFNQFQKQVHKNNFKNMALKTLLPFLFLLVITSPK